ncbi:MAG: hypothetical protein HeimC2_38120 [Candidatus Heimdallarchaeota archaeon LC_2]|nr:MAG: hypothetical protein HeimC2_38120 [Candidatus Heimdallarchaeota archaeon LC_2]
MLNILLSGKICVKDWIEKQDEEWGLHFHLHYNDCDGQFEGCDISVGLPTLSYFSLQPAKNHDEINIRLKKANYKNNVSNLIIQSGPKLNKLQFSPKIGISKPRIRDRVVLDSNTTIFEKEVGGEQTRMVIPKSITQVYKTKIIDTRTKADLQDMDILRIMEGLIKLNVCNSYDFSSYEERIILFISIDADQEEIIVTKNLPAELQESLSNLNHTKNLQLVILVD